MHWVHTHVCCISFRALYLCNSSVPARALFIFVYYLPKDEWPFSINPYTIKIGAAAIHAYVPRPKRLVCVVKDHSSLEPPPPIVDQCPFQAI